MAMELKEITTGVENSSGRESKEQQLCDSCKETDYDTSTLAKRFCIKCEKKLCLLCYITHADGGDHLVVDLNEQNEQLLKKFKESNFCNYHNKVLAKLFCVTCRKVICSDCSQESHSSHTCANVCDIAEQVAKQAETEYENLFHIQSHFDNERMKFTSEKMKVTKTVKEMEMEIRKRCDEITQFVYDETNALLKELDTFRKERLDEIELERKKMEEHAFTFEKFKEYCDKIKSNTNPNYTCEAEGILRNIVDDLKARLEGSWKSGLFAIEFSIQKTDFEQALSSAIGRFTVSCQYKMTESGGYAKLDKKEVHGMARLHDKLYVLSDSISIRRLQHPFASVGEIEISDVKSPKHIVASSKTSCLYIYDKGEDCIWKVSVPDHQLSRWLHKVKEPNALSPTSEAELLVLRNFCVEVYNEHAILVRRFNLPAAISYSGLRSLRSFEETTSGRYIALGEESVFILRRNGSIINQFQPASDEERKNSPTCLILSPYHIFLQCRTTTNANTSNSRTTTTITTPKTKNVGDFIGNSMQRFSDIAADNFLLQFGRPANNVSAFSHAQMSPDSCPGSMMSLTFDLACPQIVHRMLNGWKKAAASCYLKETKQVLLLEEFGWNTKKFWNLTAYNLI